jgi:hypothetical protein
VTTCREVRSQAELDAALSDTGACIHLKGQGRFSLSGSATVRAYDSATVRASDSATVGAYDSATVRAYGSATVRAYGSATVRASKYVAIHKYGTTPVVVGGVVIDVPDLDNCDAATWIDYYAAKSADADARDDVVLYKALDGGLVSGHGFAYPIGETVTCDDFNDVRVCGNGLHFGPTPRHARRYHQAATRYVACAVKADQIIPLGDKVKAPSCRVLHEVDIDAQQLLSVGAGVAGADGQ